MQRPVVLVPLALALTAALSACGGSEPDVDDAQPRSTASPTPSATPSSAADDGRPSAGPSASAAPVAASPAAPPAPSASGSAVAAPPAESPVDPLSPVPGRESAAPTGQPVCRAADLTLVDADTLVLPEFVHEVFVLRTQGPDCQLEGHPAVRLLDASGALLPVTVGRGGQGLPADAPQPVTLSATTSLSFVVATPRDGTCVEATVVEVTLPGTSSPVRTATALPVCGGSAGVSPVLRRVDDE